MDPISIYLKYSTVQLESTFSIDSDIYSSNYLHNLYSVTEFNSKL